MIELFSNEMKDESIKIFQQNLSPLIVSDQYQIIYEKKEVSI